MSVVQMLHTFLTDKKVEAAFLVVLLDLVLGITAAVSTGTFKLSYVADFLKNDVAFKLVPYFGLYAAAIIAGGTDIVIPGLDLGVLAGGAYVLVMGAWVASILSSLTELGIGKGISKAIAGGEHS